MNLQSFMIRVVVSLSLVLLSATAWAPSPANGASVQVKEVTFKVRLSNGQENSLVGFLYFKPDFKVCFKEKTLKEIVKCLLDKRLKNRTLQVLVHGITYNHRYWDSRRINEVDYSYARFMAERGYAVLALDLLGTGESSVPDGNTLTPIESASVLEQVLSSLQTKRNPIHRKFKRIALVGHSLGTLISVFTLGTYPNAADVLIATGWSYAPHVVLDPDLVEMALGAPDSYIRFPPALREALFYFTGPEDLDVIVADPDVVTFDNTFLADQFPKGILIQGRPLLDALASNNPNLKLIKELSRVDKVIVPVLVQLGEFDVIAPARLADQEPEFYSGSSDVTVQVLNEIGHSFNLHRNHEQSWMRIDGWIEQRLGK